MRTKSIRDKREMHTEMRSENLKGDHSEKTDKYGRIILKWIFLK
jgi:hypothetical protein